MKLKWKLQRLFCILLIVIGTLSASQSAKAQATIKFDPDSLTLPKGVTARIKVLVDNVKDLYAYQFNLIFNANVVEVVSLEEGEFLKGDGATTFYSPPKIDSTTGKATNVVNSRLGVTTSRSGSGILAYVTFRAKNNGSGKFTLENAKFSTVDVKSIQVVSGESNVIVGVPPTVVVLTEAVEYSINATFNVRISVRDAVDLTGYQFDFGYDPKILEALKVEEGGFLKKDGAKTFFSPPKIDASGKITGIIASRLGVAGILGEGDLAVISFKAIGSGKSDLKIQNISLSDSQSKPITAKISDSSVTVKKPTAPWDVNKDGVVNIFDFVIVAGSFGMTISSPPPQMNPDVNGDGVVDIFDFVMVGAHFGEEIQAAPAFVMMSSPASGSISLKSESVSNGILQLLLEAKGVKNLHGLQFDLAFDPNILEAVSVSEGGLLRGDGARTYWHSPKVDNISGLILGAASVRISSDPVNSDGVISALSFKLKRPNRRFDRTFSPDLKASISLLRVVASDKNGFPVGVSFDKAKLSWESLVIPEKSLLGQNYPNPFNPETWIPFELAQESMVAIRIYNVSGELVRSLNLGQKPAGVYVSKARAAYWDGRNDYGELASTGVYFYAIEVRGFAEVRKMIVLK